MATSVTLFIGLLDKDTHTQMIPTLDAARVASNVCVENVGGATISDATGFHTHKDGTIVIEPSLRVELLDPSMESVECIVSTLKTVLNQESILKQVQDVTCTYC